METNIFRTGDVLHCSGHKWISRAIKWATKSKINHTAMFIWLWDELYIIDAQNNGVNVKTYQSWVDEYGYDYVVMRNPRPTGEAAIATKAMSKVGLTAYDFEGLLIKQPIELITGKWHKKPANRETDKMYCSEFVSWVYGIEESYRFSPKDFLEYCQAQMWETVYSHNLSL